jgi:hypothetical protein
MSRRASSILGGAAAVALLVALTGGLESGQPPTLVFLIVAFVGAALVLTRDRRTGVADRPWSGSAAPLAAAPSGPRPAPSTWAAARALGRAEGRELVSSPAYGVGLAFCGLILFLFGGVWGSANPEPWFRLAQQAPWYCYPLVGMTAFAAHRAVTRAARDGADELFESCPLPAATRTIGFLLSAVMPVVSLVVFLALFAALLAWRSSTVYGGLSIDDTADVLAALLLGAGGVALGVALGRWVRFSLTPVVVVVGIAVATGVLNGIGGHHWNPYVQLSTAPTVEGDSPVFGDRPALWHLAWVVGLIALVVGIALARHRRDRLVALLLVGSLAVVAAAGIGATRPMSPTSAHQIAALIHDPASHQECRATSGVSVCVFPRHRGLLGLVVDLVAPVAAALPDGGPRLILRQRYEQELADLPPEVRSLVRPSDLRVPDGEVPLSYGDDLLDPVLSPAFDLALASTGLPARADAELLPLVVAGQARGVVALWLASRGLAPADVEKVTTSPTPYSASSYERGSLAVGNCSVPSVVWSAQDLAAARAVVALPASAVADVLATGWDHWSDPATGTDELLYALGLAAVGPFDSVAGRPGDPC